MNPVVVFDSGIGGLPYLNWLIEAAPGEAYVYVADRKGFPYGDKAPDIVLKNIIEVVEIIIGKFEPRLVLVACNTASVVALQELRERFAIPFVGVVPAIKPAARLSQKKRVGLLATGRTVVEAYTDKLIADFASDCVVLKVGDSEMVRFVEKELFCVDAKRRRSETIRAAEACKDADVDSVVLGCTHFIYLEDDLKKLLGPDVHVIDSLDGVGNQVLRVLNRQKDQNDITSRDNLLREFYVTDTLQPRDPYIQIAAKFGLSLKGTLTNDAGQSTFRNQ